MVATLKGLKRQKNRATIATNVFNKNICDCCDLSTLEDIDKVNAGRRCGASHPHFRKIILSKTRHFRPPLLSLSLSLSFSEILSTWISSLCKSSNFTYWTVILIPSINCTTRTWCTMHIHIFRHETFRESTKNTCTLALVERCFTKKSDGGDWTCWITTNILRIELSRWIDRNLALLF